MFESFIEQAFWDAGKDLIKGLESQVYIEGYRVDFLIPSEMIVIELDGYDFHGKTSEQFKKDHKRDRQLLQAGYYVIRFTGSDINNDVKKCVQEVLTIQESIIERRVLPQKSTELYFCVRMQEVISHLVKKFDQHIEDDEFVLCLKYHNNSFLPLTIEKFSPEFIRISHYFVQADDFLYNPSIEFYIYSHGDWKDWTPINIADFVYLYRGDYVLTCAEIVSSQ